MIVVIVLMNVHLFGNTELIQIFRFPKLISHYFQHKGSDVSISFGDFLFMHYGGDDGTSSDDDTDSQLPYQNKDHHCLFATYYPITQYALIVTEMKDTSDYYDQLVLDNLSKYVSLILQPPRTS